MAKKKLAQSSLETQRPDLSGDLIDQAKRDDANLPRIPAQLTRAVLSEEMHPLTMWRKVFGVTMADLADRAQMRRASISDIENGNVDPRYGTVVALAAALHPDLNASDIMP